MKPNKTRILMSTAAFLLAISPAAVAQSQLQGQVSAGMRNVGITVDGYEELTINNLAQIKAILESEKSTSQQEFEIKHIIDTSMERPTAEMMPAMPTGDIRDLIRKELLVLGMHDVDVDGLTTSKVAEIYAVVESDLSTVDQVRRIEAIINF